MLNFQYSSKKAVAQKIHAEAILECWVLNVGN